MLFPLTLSHHALFRIIFAQALKLMKRIEASERHYTTGLLRPGHFFPHKAICKSCFINNNRKQPVLTVSQIVTLNTDIGL